MSKFSIYVHIPFCAAKCNYCSFVSGTASKTQIEKYIDYLCDEIKEKSNFFANKTCSTIYFGGGTPSLISEKYIEKVLKTIKKCYKLCKNTEISIECNPCTVNLRKLKKYFDIGINRISFGVQSTSLLELKLLGRRHTARQAIEKIKRAKKVGFKNISADVMIGIPEQNTTSLEKTLNNLLALDLQHISAYMLMIEKNTPLEKQVRCREVKVADDDTCVELYNFVYNKLKAKGFHRYEISNFAMKGFECKHNINYWKLGEYIGFGVSAHSFYDGKRIANSNKISEYMQNKNISVEKLSSKEKIEEYIMLSLRLKSGINLTKLKEMGYNLLQEKQKEISKLKNLKLISVCGNHLKIRERAFGLCNAIVLELI